MQHNPEPAEDNSAGLTRALADSVEFLATNIYTDELATDEPSAITFELELAAELNTFVETFIEQYITDTPFDNRYDFEDDEFQTLLLAQLRTTIYGAFTEESIRNRLHSSDTTNQTT